jgi:uncharacterized protein involved in exopolysaccharide biosynthesis
MSSPRLFFLSVLGGLFAGALIVLFLHQRRKAIIPHRQDFTIH